ncbi:Pkd1l3 [Symbiodinium sp. CCMP2592]|nr:Pkd1l3 [Symbiodinium sp. CCMP2592]CAE7379101.1 Pkd1l3 [Symbiodinium sp. CCMP2592]CAE7829222.1 Pkd1l3 [Symbiodinium sp. CCMP2592]
MAARANAERQALEGLASEWEACSASRRRLLLDGYLLKWPKAELTGVPSYASAALNYESLEPLFRLWAANMPLPKSPRDANAPAAEADDDDYENLADDQDPEPEENEDVVAYMHGRLDDADEDDEPSTDAVLALSNEAEGSSAEPPTVEVPGHISNARAENEDSSAKPLTVEVSGHIGNARAENEDSRATQATRVSGHTSGNSAVLASTAEASAEPELILCSDEENEAPKRPVPTPLRARAFMAMSKAERLNDLKQRLLQLILGMYMQLKQTKEDRVAKTTFRRDGPVRGDPSRVETQTYDIEAVAERWQNAGSVDGELVDLGTEAAAAAAEVLTKEKQDAMMEATKANEDAKPGHGRGGRGRGGRGRGGRGRGKTPLTADDEEEAEPEPTEAKPSKRTKNAKKHASEPAEPTEAQPTKRTKRTKDAKESAPPTEPTEAKPAKRTKDAEESASPTEPTEAKPAKRTKDAEESASPAEPKEAKPAKRTKHAEESASPAEPKEAKPAKRTKDANGSASPTEPTEAKPAKRTKDAKESAPPTEPTEAHAPKPRRGRPPKAGGTKDAEPPKPKRSTPAKDAAEQTEAPKAKRTRTNVAKENAEAAEKEANASSSANSDKKAQQARRKAIRDGLDMPVYSFVDIDFYWSRNGMGVKLRNCANVEEQGKQVLYLGYKGVAEHTAMITMWKFARPADLVEKAKGHLTPALVEKLATIKEDFANRSEV